MSACPACDHEVIDPSQRFCSQCGHDLGRKHATDELDGLVGKVVDGRYKVLGRIGAGGMGLVYRVEHVRMGKVAAMKVLRRDLADDAQAAKRFVREVEVVSKLEHPNIVQTFDFGEWRGLLYLVMELVRGEDLAAIVRRDGPLPLSRALPLFAQVCEALEEAHLAGIVHRDLKPDNIVVFRRREGEHVKVLDFGLAKLRERPELGEVTGAGSLVGTPYYMAPEQVRGEPVDERTDVYALGATVYRVMTGQPAFPGDSPVAILSRHLTDPVVPPSERREGLPLELDHLVLKAMAKDPANRFASARALREGIQDILARRLANPEESQPLPSWIEKPQTGGDTGASDSALTAVEVPGARDDSDLASRLRREDVDAFESRLMWRRRVLRLAVPLFLVAAGWGGVRLLQRPERAGPTETEPNDSAATANLLPNGTPVFGHLREPHEDGIPDFDYFRVPSGRTPRTVLAAVSGLPDLNVVLELYDVTGALLLRADGGGVGRGEVLGPVSAGSGEVFVRVRPLWLEGNAAPLQASSAPYALTVTWGRPDRARELEPNETEAQASSLHAGLALMGHLSHSGDVDVFSFEAAPGGAFAVSLEAGGALELVLEGAVLKRKVAAAPQVVGEPFTVPETGRVSLQIREAGRKKNATADRTQPYTITVTPVP
ncbi:MAG: protein kinase [Myxococcales bacterium]|nr:protein kinase [Myxococcales bacterium]